VGGPPSQMTKPAIAGFDEIEFDGRIDLVCPSWYPLLDG
jgi:hypothetical protein